VDQFQPKTAHFVEGISDHADCQFLFFFPVEDAHFLLHCVGANYFHRGYEAFKVALISLPRETPQRLTSLYLTEHIDQLRRQFNLTQLLPHHLIILPHRYIFPLKILILIWLFLQLLCEYGHQSRSSSRHARRLAVVGGIVGEEFGIDVEDEVEFGDVGAEFSQIVELEGLGLAVLF